MKKIHYSIFYLFAIIYYSYGQEIPNEFYQFDLEKIYSNKIDNWHENSVFGPVRFTHKKLKSDSLFVNARFGTRIYNNKRSIYGYGHFTFKKYFHGYLYPRIVTEPHSFERFSGIPLDIDRAGFIAGETDLSGISFENEWMIIQFGRGRQSWGAGNNIELAINENSNAYDYGMLDLDFKKLRVRYFHGYLETDSLYVNRYITGRGLEWNNQKNILIALSEVIIYSGKNRPIDFSYFNPMSTHLEIEMNNRQNNLGTDSGNGVWQLSFDCLFIANFRISGNFLFDEFVLDREQKDEGKDAAKAFSCKFVYNPIINENSFLSCYFSIISVGTNTFKHEYGNNNFVQRNDPLGWEIGNDSREIEFGLNSLFHNKIITSLSVGNRLIGEKNMIDNLYEPYIGYVNESFPSGVTEQISFGSTSLKWWYKPNISIISKLEIKKSDKLGTDIELDIGIDIFYGIKATL